MIATLAGSKRGKEFLAFMREKTFASWEENVRVAFCRTVTSSFQHDEDVAQNLREQGFWVAREHGRLSCSIESDKKFARTNRSNAAQRIRRDAKIRLANIRDKGVKRALILEHIQEQVEAAGRKKKMIEWQPPRPAALSVADAATLSQKALRPILMAMGAWFLRRLATKASLVIQMNAKKLRKHAACKEKAKNHGARGEKVHTLEEIQQKVINALRDGHKKQGNPAAVARLNAILSGKPFSAREFTIPIAFTKMGLKCTRGEFQLPVATKREAFLTGIADVMKWQLKRKNGPSVQPFIPGRRLAAIKSTAADKQEIAPRRWLKNAETFMRHFSAAVKEFGKKYPGLSEEAKQDNPDPTVLNAAIVKLARGAYDGQGARFEISNALYTVTCTAIPPNVVQVLAQCIKGVMTKNQLALLLMKGGIEPNPGPENIGPGVSRKRQRKAWSLSAITEYHNAKPCIGQICARAAGLKECKLEVEHPCAAAFALTVEDRMLFLEMWDHLEIVGILASCSLFGLNAPFTQAMCVVSGVEIDLPVRRDLVNFLSQRHMESAEIKTRLCAAGIEPNPGPPKGRGAGRGRGGGARGRGALAVPPHVLAHAAAAALPPAVAAHAAAAPPPPQPHPHRPQRLRQRFSSQTMTVTWTSLSTRAMLWGSKPTRGGRPPKNRSCQRVLTNQGGSVGCATRLVGCWKAPHSELTTPCLFQAVATSLQTHCHNHSRLWPWLCEPRNGHSPRRLTKWRTPLM